MSDSNKVSRITVIPRRRKTSTANDYMCRIDQVCLAAVYHGMVKGDIESRRRLLESVYTTAPEEAYVILPAELAAMVSEVDYQALYERLMPVEETENS